MPMKVNFDCVPLVRFCFSQAVKFAAHLLLANYR